MKLVQSLVFLNQIYLVLQDTTVLVEITYLIRQNMLAHLELLMISLTVLKKQTAVPVLKDLLAWYDLNFIFRNFFLD